MKKILAVLLLCPLFLWGCNRITRYTDKITDYIEENPEEKSNSTKSTETVEHTADTTVKDSDTDEGRELQKNENYEEKGYAYAQLDSKQKEIYLEVYSVLEKQEEEIKISTLDSSAVDFVFDCIFMDHPELFWVEGYSLTQYKENDVLKSMAFSGIYTMTKEERTDIQKKMEEALKSCLKDLPENADDYEKVKYVYEYIIKNTTYNLQAENSQNIISVLLNHESVCQGYAYAMHYLLNYLSVPCTTVTGTVMNGEPHSWNLVQVEGEYYYVDATWGDCGYLIENTDEGSLYNGIGDINYDYLCITAEMLQRTHSLNQIVPFPACDSLAANYYVKEDKYFTELDSSKLQVLFEKGYGSEEAAVSFMCSDGYVFQEIYQYLLTERNIFAFTNGNNEIMYIKNEEQLTFLFFL